jgi:hypothetical protein
MRPCRDRAGDDAWMKEVVAVAEGKIQIPLKVHLIAEGRGWGGSVWIDKAAVPRASQAGSYVYRDGLVTAAGWRGPLLFIRVAQPWREVATMRHGRRIAVRTTGTMAVSSPTSPTGSTSHSLMAARPGFTSGWSRTARWPLTISATG